MSMSSGNSGGTLAEINVTPLVDVMLVLLIVFMISAPMLQTGVDVNLPDAKAQTVTDDGGKLFVTITKDKRAYIGKSEVPFAELEEKLKANEKLKVDQEIYLHADESLNYGVVVKVMAAVKLAGAKNLVMITDPLE